MSAQQRRAIQINHALSGVHGQQLKNSALKINEARKQILKKLERKKKLSSIIHDQLYGYLQKFPQQKEGLHLQQIKKKKVRGMQVEQKSQYEAPCVYTVTKQFLTKGGQHELSRLKQMFQFPLQGAIQQETA